MPFVTPTQPNLDAYLVKSHVDYLNIWASVHDEGDFTVLQFLRNAIMKTTVDEVSLKDLLDKYNLPGLGMSYDVEFDEFLSWTAGESVNVYEYPTTKNEKIMYHLWLESKKNRLRPNIQSSDEGRIITQPFHLADKEWLKMITDLPEGKDKLLIQTSEDQLFEYERLVTYPE